MNNTRVDIYPTEELKIISISELHCSLPMYHVSISRSRDKGSLSLSRTNPSIKNLTRTKELVFNIVVDDSVRTLDVPDNIRKGIMRYLQSHSTFSDMTDCVGFVSDVYGRSGENGKDGGFSLVGQIFSIDDLSPGDIIMLCDRNQYPNVGKNFHMLIYIGEDLFISKYYSNGPIAIQNLKQIQSIPLFNITLKLVYKPNNEPPSKTI